MSWTEKTAWYGGGDNPFDSRRIYKYRFRDNPLRFFLPHAVHFRMPFDLDPQDTDNQEDWHQRVLAEAPFCIRGRNVMNWARECITEHQALFYFEIDSGIRELLGKENICTLTAKFGSRGAAAMFKLTFGGKF